MDLLIPIDRARPEPLVEQLCQGIRAALADGTLVPGDRLPSTRELARQLGLTRFTVDDAYTRLVSEGYLVARHGSGTYVAEQVRLPQPVGEASPESVPAPRRLSMWAGRLRPRPREWVPPQTVEFTFTSGTPALDQLPLAVWRRLLARETRDATFTSFTYGPTAGLPALREAIAAYVGRARGVTCTPGQVIVTSGSQQAMDLVMRLVLDPGATCVVEDPCYRWVRAIAALTGATLAPVPVDAHGLRVDQLAHVPGDVRLACVTPSHQYPTGAILPLARRLALLEWARERGALILEDDYDGELRYDARPLPALAALAASSGPGQVIYMGSFSKVLFPSIRLGYLVVPPDLVEVFLAAKTTVERQAPTLTQAAVAAFITEGHFERHLARMRRVYASRHEALVEALDTHLPGIAVRQPAMRSAGLHVLTRFDVDLTEEDVVARAAAHGVGLDGAGGSYLVPPARPHIALGCAVMPEDRIRAGIARLAEALRDVPRAS